MIMMLFEIVTRVEEQAVEDSSKQRTKIIDETLTRLVNRLHSSVELLKTKRGRVWDMVFLINNNNSSGML